MATPESPLQTEVKQPIFVTEGTAPPNLKDRRLISGWSIAFVGAICLLTWLCVSKPDPYLESLIFLEDGLYVTFKIALLSIAIAVPLGLLTGLGRLSRIRAINLLASTYVEVIRGIPLLMQLFYIYFALGQLFQISPTVSAVTALSVCYAAYMGEVFRAGILSVSKGQSEAARSLGFNRMQTMTLIILPQAMRTIIPPVGNECIALLKDTSLVSVIAVADLMRRGREFSTFGYTYFETYTVVALVYLIITLLLSKLLSLVERRLSQHDLRS